jgi:hypothetical protein
VCVRERARERRRAAKKAIDVFHLLLECVHFTLEYVLLARERAAKKGIDGVQLTLEHVLLPPKKAVVCVHWNSFALPTLHNTLATR